MKQSSLTMLKALASPKKVKVPKVSPNPALVIAIHPGTSEKPVNDPTDPNQLLESERTAVGKTPSKRVPVKLGLPRSPIKINGKG